MLPEFRRIPHFWLQWINKDHEGGPWCELGGNGGRGLEFQAGMGGVPEVGKYGTYLGSHKDYSFAGVLGAMGDKARKRSRLLWRLLLLTVFLVNGTYCVPGTVESALHTWFYRSFQDPWEIGTVTITSWPSRRLMLREAEQFAWTWARASLWTQGFSSSRAHALVSGVVMSTDASESVGMCGQHWEAFALIKAVWKGWGWPLYGGSGISE